MEVLALCCHFVVARLSPPQHGRLPPTLPTPSQAPSHDTPLLHVHQNLWDLWIPSVTSVLVAGRGHDTTLSSGQACRHHRGASPRAAEGEQLKLSNSFLLFPLSPLSRLEQPLVDQDKGEVTLNGGWRPLLTPPCGHRLRDTRAR